MKEIDVVEIKLKVNEIFYSLQGEGGRAGEASIFIRLAGCNQKCWFCDTDYTTGTEMTLLEILKELRKYPCSWIVWTGGEPTLQLNNAVVLAFKLAGYWQAIESNGTNPIPAHLDYVTISPKGNLDELYNFDFVEEIRLPFSLGRIIPNIEDLPKAKHYYLSPIFLGKEKKREVLEQDTLNACVQYCLQNSKWKLSIQQQKIWKIK